MAPPPDEFSLIRTYFAPLAAAEPGAFDLLDDAAALAVPAGSVLVVTADAIVAGIHYPDDTTPGDIARRVMRVNLSDIAAKGARPRAYTLTAQLPPTIDEAWLAAFAAALGEEQARYGVSLLGGDTTATTGPLTLSVNMFGEILENNMVLRRGARVGDAVYVSGAVGDAMLGLECLMGRRSSLDRESAAALKERFRMPEPRLALGQALVGVASAAADVSDGLIADLGHICEASGVAAEIDLDAVPISDAAARAVTDDQPLRLSLLAGGDDYELVFTVPRAAEPGIDRIAAASETPVRRIGRIVDREGAQRLVTVRDAAGHPVEAGHGGYRHFDEPGAG